MTTTQFQELLAALEEIRDLLILQIAVNVGIDEAQEIARELLTTEGSLPEDAA